MAHITRDEVRKLAEISRIHVNEEDVASLARDMEQVLEHASSLQEVAQRSDVSMLRSTPRNTLRADVREQWDTQALLDQAPEEDNGYYVVPKVIQQS